MAMEAVEGIVIGETNYHESSKILHLITKEYGRIGVLSKGCRSLKSKLRSVSRKLSYGVFYIHYKKEGLSTLNTVDVLDSLKNILEDIQKISYASYLLDLADQVLKQTDSQKIYPILISSLKKINEGMDPEIITNIMELKLLEDLGVRPCIDECAICGNNQQIVTIDAFSGGYICKNCYHNQKIYDSKTIQLIRMFYYVDISKISRLSIRDSIKKEISEFIDEYYERYTGLYLKSKQFLTNLKKLG